MGKKVILYIAASLDGFIAKHNDDLSFLSLVEQEGEDYGYSEFIKTVDTVIMGRKTYDWLTKQVEVFPHRDMDCYVITRYPGQDYGRLKYYSGNLSELIYNLKKNKGKNIFIDGGAELVSSLLKENLIDEFIISIIPLILGGGIRLFYDGLPELKLELINVKKYEKGLVQIHYKKI